MSTAEVIGIVLGSMSLVLLVGVFFLLQRVYVVVRRERMPKVDAEKGKSP